MARSLSYHQRQVLRLLREHSEISYEDISAQLDIHRMTAVIAVRRLEHQGQITKIRGSGPRPNRYLVTQA